MSTLIKNGRVIAWVDDKHTVLDHGVVVFEGNEITYVGESFEGHVDETIDATGRIVMPGFVNTHIHLTDTPFTKGYLEDNVGVVQRSKAEYSANLYRALPTIRRATDPDAQVAGAECVLAEFLLSGSTTIMEMSFDDEIMGGDAIEPVERVADAAGKSGIRCYSGPRYRTTHYFEADDGSIVYRPNPSNGRDRFDLCKTFCEEWDGKYDGRLRTMLAPGQVDTCDPELLRETRKAADALGVCIQLHAGQSVQEFRKIKKAHGLTTVEYMNDTGLLGPDFIIGHGQWLTESGDINDLGAHELEALRSSQSTVAHLPWCKGRRGGIIDSIAKYRRHGIRQSIGTDTFPGDMFNEMRMAAVICKIVEGQAGVGLATEVFEMATVGGADAFGRPDLGRLAAGCKADILFVRIDTPKATPIWDPFRFLVFTATGDDVDRVYIDGNLVVKDRQVLTMDVPAVLDRANEAAQRVWSKVDL